MDYALWDIDNCIADDQARLPLIDWHLRGDARYERYHAASGADPAGNLPFFYSIQARPIFTTARPERWRALTLGWLASARVTGVDVPLLLMRQPEEDGVRSPLVKARMVAQIRADLGAYDRIVAAYDDHPENIQMLQRLGINAKRLFIHDIRHDERDVLQPGTLLPSCRCQCEPIYR